MEEADGVVVQKRQAAIKLAKNLEPFNPDLGQDYDAVYVETLTEEIKQIAREIKKIAKVVALLDTKETGYLSIKVDEEEERVTKLLRRYCTRIQKMADLIYEVSYVDYEQLEQDALLRIMDIDEDDDDEDT